MGFEIAADARVPRVLAISQREDHSGVDEQWHQPRLEPRRRRYRVVDGRVRFPAFRPCGVRFAITDSELSVIAALAQMGLTRTPTNGYSAPAASGTPSAL